MKPYIDDEDHFDIGFEQFKLRPGLEMEVRDEAGKLLGQHVQFVSTLPNKDVLLSIQAGSAEQIALKEHARYQFSGFNGRFDFSFTASALKVDATQFTVLLDTPAMVSIRFVRKHQRTDLALAASITVPGQGGAVPVTVRNLSLGGASVDSVKPLGAKGGTAKLHLQITFDGKKEDLALLSAIRRVSESRESLMFNTGIEFVNASREDKLLLHYYISTLEKEFNLI